jgi:signal transduction histidine kinase
MKMRNKVFIIVGVLMISIFVVIYTIVNTVILQSFITLEDKETRESLTRTTNAFSNEIADISSKVSDWASWDDTYTFVQYRNESYIDSNLVDSTFVTLRLNLMMLINCTGQIVYSKAFNLSNATEAPVPQGMTEELAANPVLWNFSDVENKTEGVLMLPQQSLIFSSKPILTSEDAGPIMGAFIMARYIGTEEITFLSDTVRFPITVCSFNEQNLQNDFQAAHSSLLNNGSPYVRPLNADLVGGYALINDVFSNPAIMLRIELPRDIYKQGVATVNYFTGLILAICAIFGAAMMILLQQGILSPLSKLTKSVKEMGTREHASRSVSRFANDETVILEESIKNAISQRLAAIEELAGMVGHDLRNPLTSINGAAYYLKTKYESKIDERGKEMLKVIEDDVVYSNKIVNDLLEYSRKIKLEYVDTTAKMLVKDTISLVNIPKNIELIDLTDDKTEVTVDADKMKRVFVNLIKNAVDAMPQGGTLKIGCAKAANGAKFTFSDTGHGLSKEALQKICTPLFTTKAKGMGFGLSISKRFVEAHGGSLSFESSARKGTKVTVFIPQNAKAETRDEVWVELPALGASSSSEDPSPPTKTRTSAN